MASSHDFSIASPKVFKSTANERFAATLLFILSPFGRRVVVVAVRAVFPGV